MRRIGIVTEIITDGYIPLIERIEITIYDEEKDQVVTIYPTDYKRNYPYQLFQNVEYDKENDSIKPFVFTNDKETPLTNKELQAQAKCLAVVVERFKNLYALDLYKPLDSVPGDASKSR